MKSRHRTDKLDKKDIEKSNAAMGNVQYPLDCFEPCGNFKV
jgi:hypothetical protein